MKTIVVLFGWFVSIVAVCFGSETLTRNQQVSSPGPQASSTTQIVDLLNQSNLSKARIGLDFEGPESHLDGSDSMQSMALNVSRLSEQVNFSPGFTVDSLNLCQLTLKNDQVKILNFGTSSYDRYRMSLAAFLFDGKKGEKKLTPQTAVLTIPLDKLSYKGGKAPYRYTKNADMMNLVGTWRSIYKEKGFFKSRPFVIEITAAEGKDLSKTMDAGRLLFTFDDKNESETFDAAFRRAIQLCSTK